jgi:hypothetical protein
VVWAKDLKPLRVMLFRCKKHHPFLWKLKPIEKLECDRQVFLNGALEGQ